MTGVVDGLESKAGKLHMMMIVGYRIYVLQFMLIYAFTFTSTSHNYANIGTVNTY